MIVGNVEDSRYVEWLIVMIIICFSPTNDITLMYFDVKSFWWFDDIMYKGD